MAGTRCTARSPVSSAKVAMVVQSVVGRSAVKSRQSRGRRTLPWVSIVLSVNLIKITFHKCKSFCVTESGSFVSHGRPCITLRMLTGCLCKYRVKMFAEKFLLDLLIIFNVAPCILNYTQFTHQKMYYLLTWLKVLIYIKIHNNIAPACFGL